MRRLLAKVWGLRPEELLALLFFPPSVLATAKACAWNVRAGIAVPPRLQHGVIRLAVTASGVALFAWFVRRRPFGARLAWIRDVVPFLFCIAIYTNLHDTIHFVNPHDVHDVLMRIDGWLLGVQPCVWVERFYSPFLTELFSLGYMNYFLVSIAVVAYLLVARRRREMREALLGTILCFYMGYVLYVAFPAAPPWLTQASLFTRDLQGGWITEAQRKLTQLNPNASRGAFPSLHCAVTFLTLAYAWRFRKALFAVLLPMGVTLVLATVYLRHHYVVDILAGGALAAVAHRVAPALDAWWLRQRAQAAAEPARPLLEPDPAASVDEASAT